MAITVTVKTVGSTDKYSNAHVVVEPSGALRINKSGRGAKIVTYAHGRWITVTEEGMRNDGE